jgi:type II secretory pathway pseudopilin PulG
VANCAGFFLIEVMVALALLSGIAGIVATYQWHAARAYQESHIRVEALNAARDVLESIVATGRMSIQRLNESDRIVVTCSVVQAVPHLTGNLDFLPPNGLVCIEVTAAWQSFSGVPCTCRLQSVCQLDLDNEHSGVVHV